MIRRLVVAAVLLGAVARLAARPHSEATAAAAPEPARGMSGAADLAGFCAVMAWFAGATAGAGYAGAALHAFQGWRFFAFWVPAGAFVVASTCRIISLYAAAGAGDG
jgi:hypothetical protein